ncbi:MAG TPA: hypothetical protein VI193_10150 [Acidimicrobiia bacterium]
MVGSIEPDGIQNGWMRKVLMMTAMARAVRRRPGSSARNDRFFSGAGLSSGAPSTWFGVGRVSRAAP